MDAGKALIIQLIFEDIYDDFQKLTDENIRFVLGRSKLTRAWVGVGRSGRHNDGQA